MSAPARGGYRWSPTRKLCRGREQSAAKLTDTVVGYIRAHYIRYDRCNGAEALARQFNVSKTLVQLVVAGVRWKHVPPASKRAWEA